MTKRDLSLEVARLYPQYAVREVETMVNAVFESLTAALAQGERIELRGFGSFEVRERRAREGRNPRTRAIVAVPAKRVPFFKVAKELRARVDGHAALPAPLRQLTAPARRRSPASRGDVFCDLRGGTYER
jgi:integration host factor subunit beta